jgi:hypothetical protein
MSPAWKLLFAPAHSHHQSSGYGTAKKQDANIEY